MASARPGGAGGPLGTQSCTVWADNYIHDNNNPNVPGNGSGLAGGSPVGTGMILAGSTYVTLSGNTVSHNGALGRADRRPARTRRPPPADVPNPCQGGIYVPVPGGETCYYPALARVRNVGGRGLLVGQVGDQLAPGAVVRDGVPDSVT